MYYCLENMYYCLDTFPENITGMLLHNEISLSSFLLM